MVVLSSAEAETYALVATACETLGLQARARDLGIEMNGELFTGASAALGIVARTGIGQGPRTKDTRIPRCSAENCRIKAWETINARS